MDNTMFGMKEVYEVVITAPYDLRINNVFIPKGEPILVFSSLQMLNFNEIKEHINATGGYGNQVWVSWDRTRQLDIRFSQGVMSRLHLAFLGNANIGTEQKYLVPMWEELETNESAQVELKHTPANDDIWAYNSSTGEHLRGSVNENVISFDGVEPYTDVQVRYVYEYQSPATVLNIGRQLIPGYLQMTMKTRLKDDITGKTVTGVFSIPQVKLMSDFSIRLGSDAPPVVGNFAMTAFPTGSKGSEKVMDFILLNDDVDSDF